MSMQSKWLKPKCTKKILLIEVQLVLHLVLKLFKRQFFSKSQSEEREFNAGKLARGHF